MNHTYVVELLEEQDGGPVLIHSTRQFQACYADAKATLIMAADEAVKKLKSMSYVTSVRSSALRGTETTVNVVWTTTFGQTNVRVIDLVKVGD
jgi:hypothetical protein